MFNLITHKVNNERSDYLYTHFLLETNGSAPFFQSKRRIVWWVYTNIVLRSKVLKNRRDNEYDAPMILKIMHGKIIFFERYFV